MNDAVSKVAHMWISSSMCLPLVLFKSLFPYAHTLIHHIVSLMQDDNYLIHPLTMQTHLESMHNFFFLHVMPIELCFVNTLLCDQDFS